MNDKSHVAMEAKVCPICTKQHQYDCGILLDRRLKQVFDSYKPTVTGWGLCEECFEKEKEYVAIIVCDEEKSNDTTLEGVYRTGECIWIRKTVWDKIFIDQPIPPKGIAFMDHKVVGRLKAMVPEGQD
jgi:hypothetical protein